jgi:phosphate transport system substrate-binding protein
MQHIQQLTQSQRAFTYVPATQFPLAILVKLDGFKGNLQLSPATLAKIFQGKITKWNDAAIVADNTVVNAKTKKKTVAKLPATDITVVYRSDKSGSTGILTGWFVADCCFSLGSTCKI